MCDTWHLKVHQDDVEFFLLSLLDCNAPGVGQVNLKKTLLSLEMEDSDIVVQMVQYSSIGSA